MRLGTFHKKKRKIINTIKINFLSVFFKNKYNVGVNGKIIKSCLLIHDNNKIGDLIVLSALYRILAERNISLYVVSTGTGHDFFKSHPHITQFFIKKNCSIYDTLKVTKELKKHNFDVILDPFETFPSFGHSLLLAGLKDSYIVGFDKWYKRYYSSYHPHDENLREHMSTRVKVIAEHLFGDDFVFDDSYDLAIPEQIEKAVREFVGDTRVVIINPLGAKKICRLSPQQISLIHNWLRANYPQLRIIYTGHPDDLLQIKVDNVETLPYKDFIYTVALARLCDFVITVDTALVHIASAYERPTLAFYPAARDPAYPSPLIWAPNSKRAVQLISSTCHVSDIDSDTLLNGLHKLLQEKK